MLESEAVRDALDTTKDIASRGLETTKEVASRGGRAVVSLYQGARKTITQEEAWAETERSVSELAEVVGVQHAMILDLLARVERLEAAARQPAKPE
jgi:hypothetical protein